MIPFLRNLVFKDFWLKLFSLALAALIWFTVTFVFQKETSPGVALTVPSEDRTFSDLPVVVLSSASDVRNFKVDPKEVNVTVKGDPRVLHDLQSKDIRAIVDLTDIESAHDLRKRIEVSTPAGVTHVRVEPEYVMIIVPPAR